MGQQPENTKLMKTSPSPSSSSSSKSWKLDSSPMIYLYGGIGVMLLLIMLAMLMLTYSLWRIRLSEIAASRSGDHSQKTGQKVCNEANNSVSPEIAVIMAGDQLPTYLAAPAPVTD